VPPPFAEERFVGCLLGLAVGDALGAPFEGLTGTLICDKRGLPEQFLNIPSAEPLYYTDDTEMMIGVAETLVECGEIDETVLMRRWAARFVGRCTASGASVKAG
jgi:poly(ADP-ribose) glycohydrolase ARH3